MKKLFSIIALAILFSSCENEVKFNDPGFQVFKDDVLWKGINVTAYRSSNGALTIEALAEDGEVILKTTSTNRGTYVLGTSVSKTASYTYTKDGANIYYTTGVDVGNGEIKITEYDGATITGSFKFNARNIFDNPAGAELVNFQYGAFYKIPVVIE